MSSAVPTIIIALIFEFHLLLAQAADGQAVPDEHVGLRARGRCGAGAVATDRGPAGRGSVVLGYY